MSIISDIFESVKKTFVTQNANAPVEEIIPDKKDPLEGTTAFGGAENDVMDVDTINASSFSTIFSMGLNTPQSPNELIQQYRNMTQISFVSEAVEEITNTAICEDESTGEIVKLNIKKTDVISDKVEESIRKEFQEVISISNFNENAKDYFKQWYVDGRLIVQKIFNEKNPGNGVVDVMILSPFSIRRVWNKKDKKFFWIYSENEQMNDNKFIYQGTDKKQLKISDDLVYRVSSGLYDYDKKTSLSHLHYAIRDVNRLSTLEDHNLIYRIVRAPERRIFYIDPGNLPPKKAEEYLKQVKNTYMQSRYFDDKTGTVQSKSKHPSMLEDFFLLRRGDRGTSIETLAGGGASASSMVEELSYYQKRAAKALRVPFTRLGSETQDGSSKAYNNSQELTNEELKFYRFIDGLRSQFQDFLYELLKTQLIVKGTIEESEWLSIRKNINIVWSQDAHFVESSRLDVMEKRLSLLQSAVEYEGKYLSRKEIHKMIMNRNEEEIEELERELLEERSKYADEKNDDKY